MCLKIKKAIKYEKCKIRINYLDLYIFKTYFNSDNIIQDLKKRCKTHQHPDPNYDNM